MNELFKELCAIFDRLNETPRMGRLLYGLGSARSKICKYFTAFPCLTAKLTDWQTEYLSRPQDIGLQPRAPPSARSTVPAQGCKVQTLISSHCSISFVGDNTVTRHATCIFFRLPVFSHDHFCIFESHQQIRN